MVSGNDVPLRANSVVLIEGEETVTAEPVALSVTGILLFCPRPTLPKFKATGLTPNTSAAAPLPDREMGRAEFEAFESTEMLPLALPAEIGAKMAWKV
jgi:hypothetical protein